MSLFVGILALLGNFGAHLTRLECRFSIYIKYKNVIRLEIFSRKIVLHMTNSLHCPENTRNRFAELNLKILLLLLLLLSSLKSTFSGLKYVKLPQCLMDFHDLNGILIQILIRIIWPLEKFLWDCQLGRYM